MKSLIAKKLKFALSNKNKIRPQLLIKCSVMQNILSITNKYANILNDKNANQ